jgi:hypothetical protein
MGIQSAAGTTLYKRTAGGALSALWPTGSSATPRFAGHVPNRVIVGMAAPSDGSTYDPGLTEAETIVGQTVYESRRFTSGWISSTNFNGMLDEAEIFGASTLPVISFKVPLDNWAGVAAGDFDADLIVLYNLAIGRRTSGAGGTPQPFLCSIHHEPNGDGDLGTWAAMQQYCCYFFAGRRGGTAASTYVAGNDITDIMAWAPCGNGFFWINNTNANYLASRAAMFPPSLITALNNNGGVVMNDFYDVDYADQAGAMTDESLRVPGTGVRVSARIANFITWARANNVRSSGCGEFGAIDGTELTNCWVVMRNNRDIWSVANYFNSSQNSDHDWRLIPADYPAGNPTPPSGLVDFGGNTQSAGRLASFKTMLTQSVSATYTAPL